MQHRDLSAITDAFYSNSSYHNSRDTTTPWTPLASDSGTDHLQAVSSSGLSMAQHLCTLPTASTAQLTSPRGEVCVPAHQRRLLFQWLAAARSGIALSRLLLPEHGTVYHRLSRYRRHCRLLSIIWRRTWSQHPTSDAHSSLEKTWR